MDPNGPNQIRMNPNWSKWIQFDLNGYQLIGMNPNKGNKFKQCNQGNQGNQGYQANQDNVNYPKCKLSVNSDLPWLSDDLI